MAQLCAHTEPTLRISLFCSLKLELQPCGIIRGPSNKQTYWRQQLSFPLLIKLRHQYACDVLMDGDPTSYHRSTEGCFQAWLHDLYLHSVLCFVFCVSGTVKHWNAYRLATEGYFRCVFTISTRSVFAYNRPQKENALSKEADSTSYFMNSFFWVRVRVQFIKLSL